MTQFNTEHKVGVTAELDALLVDERYKTVGDLGRSSIKGPKVQ